MNKKKDKPAGKLYSLLPRDNMRPEEYPPFQVYKNYLDHVFQDPACRNIALTGSRGAGKSSVIMSYDNLRSGKKKFLYVSLADFEERKQEPDGASDDGQKQKDEKQKDDRQGLTQKRIEYSLMCQILARCSRKALRGSSLQRLPAERTIYQQSSNWLSAAWLWLTTVLFPGMYLVATSALLFALTFEDRLKPVLKSFFPNEDKWGQLHGYAYMALFVMLMIGLVYLLRLRPGRAMKLSRVTVKSDKAEAELQPSDEKYCLDHFKYELVHILNRMSKDIDCTVVFEDMERLSPNMCIEVLMKLRELNMLTNTFRMSYNPNVEPIRFIYALSDDLFDSESRNKFFDTIIPIVPALNFTCSRELLRDSFAQYDVPIEETQVKSTILDISEHITDYRCALAVVNEFLVLRDLAEANAIAPGKHDGAWYQSILLLAVSKVMFPRDYLELIQLDGPSVVEDNRNKHFAAGLLSGLKQKCTGPSSEKPAQEENQAERKSDKLLEYLRSKKNEIAAGAKYVGYPESYILQTLIRKMGSGPLQERIRYTSECFSNDNITDEMRKIVKNSREVLELFETEKYPPLAYEYAKLLFYTSDEVLDQLEKALGSRKKEVLLANYLEAMQATSLVPPSDKDRAAKLFWKLLKKCPMEIPEQLAWPATWGDIWDNVLGDLLARILEPQRDSIPDRVKNRKLGRKTLGEWLARNTPAAP